jgi:hypothetical protein
MKERERGGGTNININKKNILKKIYKKALI